MTTVRAATVSDAGGIDRIQVETWRAAYAGLLPPETIASSTSRRGSSCGVSGNYT